MKRAKRTRIVRFVDALGVPLQPWQVDFLNLLERSKGKKVIFNWPRGHGRHRVIVK